MRTTVLLISCAVMALCPISIAAADAPSANALQALDQNTRALDRVHTVVVAYDGETTHALAQRVLPEGWVEASWQPRGTSPWTGDGYGYGWFIDARCAVA